MQLCWVWPGLQSNIIITDSIIKVCQIYSIFNADETALYYKALPRKSIQYKN